MFHLNFLANPTLESIQGMGKPVGGAFCRVRCILLKVFFMDKAPVISLLHCRSESSGLVHIT